MFWVTTPVEWPNRLADDTLRFGSNWSGPMEIIRPRAERVALGIPILYHRPGDDHWFHAKVLNLSESGVLFGPSELEPGTPVEASFRPRFRSGGSPRANKCAWRK